MIDARRTRTFAGRLVACLLLACFTLAGGGRTASAQQIEGAPTIELATFFVRGVDSAFDPNTNSFLVVGGAGALVGVCVNSAGVPISGVMTINAEGYGTFPRASYSPLVLGGGGFLVTWAEETGAPSGIHARTVNCAGAMGPEQVISSGATAWLESGPAVAYSRSSGRFLVAWKSFPLVSAPIRVKAVLVDNNGTPVSGVVDLSPGFGRDPGVAWNSSTDQFGVSFSGETATDVKFSGFAIVPASNPAAFLRVTWNFIPGGQTMITDVTYNSATNRYLMTWFEFSSGVFAKVAEFDAAGNLLTEGIASARVGSYDALSIAFNPVSGTSLLAGVDRANDAMIGIELNSRGFPFNGENTLSATHRPSFYERVSSSTLGKSWLGTFSARQFNGIGSTLVRSFASGGGPAGSYSGGGTAPPPPPSGGCTTIQPGPGWTCVGGGWLPPTSTPPPTSPPPPPPPTGCTTIQPGPDWVCVNGGWLPPGSAPAPPPPPPPPPPPTSTCTTIQPGPGWVCVGGGWLPPSLAPAPPPPPPPTSTCTTMSPGPGWVCVGGGWLPPGSPLIPPPPPPTTSCTTVSPGAGWVCVAGGWLPPGSPLIPPSLPAPSSCTTVQPGPGWICVSGGWLPPDMACPTASPGAGWVCVGGGWLPPGHPGIG